MNGIHDGHRQRMRERLKIGGIECMQEHEVLEWLLQYSIPRGDVNPLAHRLIETFGSLAGVLNAGYEGLMTVSGVGEATALFLSNYIHVYKRYLESNRQQDKQKFKSIEDMAEYLSIQFIGCKEEVLHALLLGSNLNFIKDLVISEGSIGSVRLNLRKLTESCLNTKAAYVVLAHNHPSNILLPSDSDVRTTTSVAEVLTQLEVCLLDHLIIGSGDYISMAKSKDYSYIFRLARTDRRTSGK